MIFQDTPKANAIAKSVADRCSEFDRNGKPKAPARYAIIFQAARLGAIAALAENERAA